MEALSLVEELAPDSLGILEKGRLGVDLCTRFDGVDEWRLGQIVPVIMTDEDRKTLRVCNLLRLDETLAASINRKVPIVGIQPNEINYRALSVFKKDNLTLPDLRPLEVNLSWLSQYPLLLQQIYRVLNAMFLENGGDIDAARKLQENYEKNNAKQLTSERGSRSPT